MHERGYNEDFETCKNGLFWVQEKLFLGPQAFSVLEYHRIQHKENAGKDIIVLGIVSLLQGAKGIVVHHLADGHACWPGFFTKKVPEDLTFIDGMYR